MFIYIDIRTRLRHKNLKTITELIKRKIEEM